MSQVDPDRVAEVLVTAMHLGDEQAAQTFGLSSRTVRRYREKHAHLPQVSALVQSKRRRRSDDWLERTQAARLELLDMVLAGARTGELRDVVGALKIVSDAHTAERVINDGLGIASDEPDFTSGPLAETGQGAREAN